jgi:hypothetical protein
MIGDNGMVITTKRRWSAFGYKWTMSIAQDSDREEGSTPSSTVPQG